ncbi:MAG: hypothetical protein PF436_13295 [Prolixibacteraceae bacterium]|jgi:hypothetical protein|nr:hypothetical protein [Prolixibacteraceae bacterium]
MKKLIFTLMMMAGLALLAGTAMGQSKLTPVAGSTWDYTVQDLPTDGDQVTFSVNQSSTTPGTTVNATVGAVDATVGATTTGQATVTITWGTTTGIYNLWIEVTGQGTGTCSNRRFKPIDIQPNNFEVSIVAIGTDNDGVYDESDWTLASAATQDCPVFATGAEFNMDNTESDGSSYVFYRVDLDDSNTGTWEFEVTFTETNVTAIEYYDEGTTSWSATSPSGLAATTTEVLVRATLTNAPAGYTALTGTLANVSETYGGSTFSNGGSPTSASIDINAMPDLSGISFN